ncbi:MAG: ubiquinol-cytochrome c reductase iron-sulfur subunit [Halodesulfurarchaeum sp.]
MNDEDTEQTKGGTIRRRVLNVLGGLGVLSFFGALLTPLKDLSIATGTSAVDLEGQELVVASNEFTPAGGSETYSRGDSVTADIFEERPDSVLVAPTDLVDVDSYLIRLYYLESDQYSEPTRLDWVDQGFSAYSAVCTHLGCTVGWENEDDQPSNAPEDAREGPSGLCPCHLSGFDPYRGSEIISGPATRPVPQIGVEVAEDGTIRLTGNFEGEVGAS